MGIKHLQSLIKKHAPLAIQEKHLSSYKKSVVAVDTSILMYKFRHSYFGDPNAHLRGFLNKALFFLQHEIFPIFVFDGRPPYEKRFALSRRIIQRQKIQRRVQNMQESLDNMDDEEELSDETYKHMEGEIERLNKQSILITKSNRDESKELLRLLGMYVVEAEHEAEATCAELVEKGIADMVFSEDTDALAFGSRKVIRFSKKLNYMIEINLTEILKAFRLNFYQFVDLCILCGSDYTPPVSKIKTEEAYQMICEQEKLENVCKTYGHLLPNFFSYQDARNIFFRKTLRSNDIQNLHTFRRNNAFHFLVSEKGMNIEYVRKTLHNLQRVVRCLNSENKPFRSISFSTKEEDRKE